MLRGRTSCVTRHKTVNVQHFFNTLPLRRRQESHWNLPQACSQFTKLPPPNPPRPPPPAPIGSRNVMTELKNVKKKALLTFQDWSLEAAKWGENKTLLDTEIQWKVIHGARTCKEFQTATMRSSNEWSRDRLRRSPFVECFLTSNADVLRASSRV